MSRSSARRSTSGHAPPGRAVRAARDPPGPVHVGAVNSLQLGVEPFEVLDVVDAGDANIVPAWLERGHAMIYRKVLEVARPARSRSCSAATTRSPGRRHPAVAEARRPRSIGIVHFDAHADTANDDWGVLAGHGTPMRRLIESGAVDGRNFVQVGLRGYWPPHVFDWMQEHGLRWHLMREIEERGAEAVIDDAIAEALDGPDAIYLSIDIDVIDPGLAPGTGTPEPGGMLTARAAARRPPDRRAVELAGMDIVEVSPPYDHAETRRWPPTASLSRRSARSPCASAATRSVPLVAADRRRRSSPTGRIGTGRATARRLARCTTSTCGRPGRPRPVLALAAEPRPGPRAGRRHGPARRAAGRAATDVTGVDLDPAMLDRRAGRADGRRPPASGSSWSRPTCWTPPPGRRPLRARVHRAQLADAAGDPRRGSARPSRRSPRTSRRAAWQWSTCGCPTPTTSRRYDGRLILEWVRADPRRAPVVTKSGARPRCGDRHDALTVDLRRRLRRRASRRAAGSARTTCASCPPTTSSACRGGRAAGRALAGDYDLEPSGPAGAVVLIADAP